MSSLRRRSPRCFTGPRAASPVSPPPVHHQVSCCCMAIMHPPSTSRRCAQKCRMPLCAPRSPRQTAMLPPPSPRSKLTSHHSRLVSVKVCTRALVKPRSSRETPCFPSFVPGTVSRIHELEAALLSLKVLHAYALHCHAESMVSGGSRAVLTAIFRVCPLPTGRCGLLRAGPCGGCHRTTE